MLSIEEFIQQLCEETKLSDCAKIAEDLKGSVSNARGFKNFSKKVFRFRNNQRLEQDLKEHIMDAGDLMDRFAEEQLLVQINEELTDVKTRKDFEELLKYIKDVVGEGLTWWGRIKQIVSNIWDIMKQVANSIYEKIKSCLFNKKCLMIVGLALWMLYCHFYGTSEKVEENKISYGMSGVNTTSNTITYSRGCGELQLLQDYLWTAVKNVAHFFYQGFLSIFGMNTDYIIPQEYNYMKSAETWDQTLHNAGGGIVAGTTCAGATAMWGGGAISWALAAATPTGWVVGAASLVVGSFCYAGTSFFSKTVLGPITAEQYMQYERIVLRPIFLLLEQDIFNTVVDTLNWTENTKDKARKANEYFLLFANAVNTLRDNVVNMGLLVKQMYRQQLYAGANAALGLAVQKVNGDKIQRDKAFYREQRVQKIKDEEIATRIFIENLKDLKDRGFNPRKENKYDIGQKMLYLTMLQQGHIIDIKENIRKVAKKPEKIQALWEKYRPIMVNIFGPIGTTPLNGVTPPSIVHTAYQYVLKF